MSQENVEIAEGLLSGTSSMSKQELMAALPEVIAAIFTPDIEWVEDPQRADSRTYHGLDGVQQSFERWLEQWDEWGFEPERFVDCGRDVLVVASEQGTGAASGALVRARIFAVLSFREGKIARYREFYDEHAALAAVGLAG
jgi:ketosteroid isomerase-like protein